MIYILLIYHIHAQKSRVFLTWNWHRQAVMRAAVKRTTSRTCECTCPVAAAWAPLASSSRIVKRGQWPLAATKTRTKTTPLCCPIRADRSTRWKRACCCSRRGRHRSPPFRRHCRRRLSHIWQVSMPLRWSPFSLVTDTPTHTRTNQNNCIECVVISSCWLAYNTLYYSCWSLFAAFYSLVWLLFLYFFFFFF